MKSTDLYTPSLPPFKNSRLQDALPIRVKTLSERDRRRLLNHFFALEEAARIVCFGSALSDDAITHYVQRLNFSRDTLFGVYDDNLALLGVGHIVFTPRDAISSTEYTTRKMMIAEFGVSVVPSARGLGIGSRLFERAAIHCRNADVDTLHMHCLATNPALMHLAKKAGMEIQNEKQETYAYLKLSRPNTGRRMNEVAQEQAAIFEYGRKAHSKTAANWWNRLSKLKTR